MIDLASEPQRGVAKILVSEPTNFVPEAFLKILTQGAQAPGFRIRSQHIPDKRDDVMAIGAGAGAETTAGGASKYFGVRIKRDVNVYPLPGFIGDQAEVGFPSEVNV
jgi:hypothetical protein